MSDLVLGVKLRFELPFKLPTPVSFPFESIGDFRPITRIPKYDYALEKKIMKDIAKQRQEDQFNMLRQAQQQLSMVDLIASRKTRHKGKEPDRKSMAAAAGSGADGLWKPASEHGAGRVQDSAAAGRPNVYARPPPANVPFAVGAQPRVNMQHMAAAAPQPLVSGVGPRVGFGRPGMVELQRPPPQLQYAQQPRAEPRPVAHNPRFSTSFGVGPAAPGALQPTLQATAMRPALPPKPDEWKPQAGGATAAPATLVPPPPARHQQAPPVPPRRPRTPPEPAPPALPPKPFEAFSEFDYAAGAPGSLGTADSAGHVEQLNLLLGMGFSRPQAIQALEMYDYDVNQASNYLIDKAS
ncbi:hypothetical protein IWQ56_000707 [Coemansia nantahalensis]|nr:hypothetical protein IWQ56_000707 [Coemansia nantahalensis]